MYITLIMVSTINSKITKGDDPHIHSWTSKEDKEFFFNLRNKHNLIVMGRSTYEASKSHMDSTDDRLRIVLTRDPEKHHIEEIPGKIEFTNEKPQHVVKRLEEKGYEKMLLVGGGEINKAFFEQNLIDEIYLTIEPKLFGQGKQCVTDGGFFLDLMLLSQKRLNEKGALLLHYQVITTK